jgi:hypothetical protein
VGDDVDDHIVDQYLVGGSVKEAGRPSQKRCVKKSVEEIPSFWDEVEKKKVFIQ